jgi:predicted enzyme related to lactoylglutathione lyase
MKIGYVNVFVTDLDRAVPFFQRTLGLELEAWDADHGFAAFSAGPVRLGLAVVRDEHRDLVGRHTGVGFVVADLEAEHARLASQVVAFPMPPERQSWGGFMATFTDPDGNVFYLDQRSVD